MCGAMCVCAQMILRYMNHKSIFPVEGNNKEREKSGENSRRDVQQQENVHLIL